mmetsp:Transcript_26625/g.51918  ORF Transcript_26625/g.51918 Transcript_26625/m.51918 type:complete len:88 (+) Transcript_26625:165-428(+)
MLGQVLVHLVPFGAGTMLIKQKVNPGCDDCFAETPTQPSGAVGWELGFPDITSSIYKPEIYQWKNEPVDDYCPTCFDTPTAAPYSTY